MTFEKLISEAVKHAFDNPAVSKVYAMLAIALAIHEMATKRKAE